MKTLEDVFHIWDAVEVDAMEVYSFMFRLGTNEIQRDGEEKGLFKANPLGYYRNNNREKGTYRIMFDDTFEDTLKELQEADFSIMNGITYFGRKNTQEHASKMYAMIFDIDGVTPKTLNSLLSGAYRADAYPIPNYIALSGHGVHLYYIFEYGIPLYPNIKLQLKELKYALTEKLWNRYTSEDKKKQFQGINQGFRVIGGKTKIEGVRVRAFRLHQHPFSLNQLCNYIPEQYRVDETKLFRETKLSLVAAKKKYPEWYEKRVVQGLPKGRWTCKRDLYNWWIRQIRIGATYHHRYFAIMCLAIYGAKCGLDLEEVKKDAYELMPFLNNIQPDEPFTEQDMLSALECFDERYINFPRKDIEKLSGIEIVPSVPRRPEGKRLKQKKHIEVMNYMRRMRGEEGGRPSKANTVLEYIIEHPDEQNISKIARECGVARNTVYKYMNDTL